MSGLIRYSESVFSKKRWKFYKVGPTSKVHGPGYNLNNKLRKLIRLAV